MTVLCVGRPDFRTLNIMTAEDGPGRVEIWAKDGFVFDNVSCEYDSEHDCVCVRLKIKRPAAESAA